MTSKVNDSFIRLPLVLLVNVINYSEVSFSRHWFGAFHVWTSKSFYAICCHTFVLHLQVALYFLMYLFQDLMRDILCTYKNVHRCRENVKFNIFKHSSVLMFCFTLGIVWYLVVVCGLMSVPFYWGLFSFHPNGPSTFDAPNNQSEWGYHFIPIKCYIKVIFRKKTLSSFPRKSMQLWPNWFLPVPGTAILNKFKTRGGGG